MCPRGNMVTVTSTDAFEVRLEATLSRPPRADIHLGVKPVMLGGGCMCDLRGIFPTRCPTTELRCVSLCAAVISSRDFGFTYTLRAGGGLIDVFVTRPFFLPDGLLPQSWRIPCRLGWVIGGELGSPTTG